MAGNNNLNLSLKITALVEGIEKIRDLAKAVTDASKGSTSTQTAGVSALGAAAAATTTEINKLNQGVAASAAGAKDAKSGVANFEAALISMGAASRQLVTGLKFLAGGFLALNTVAFIKGIADTAARTQTLGVVLDTVGKNAGYTSDQLAAADKQVQALGITAAASRESLTKLLQSGLDLSFGAKLARAAQDLAVVSGENSSDTLTRLITNIQQMDTQGLRFMGIVVDREAVMRKAAEETGKAVTGAAAKTVFANAVLAEATKLSGIYESSLQTVGKQLTSMPRYIEGLKVAIGNNLLPVYLELVKGSITILKALNELAGAFNNSGQTASRLTSALDPASQGFSSMADAVKTAADGFATFIGFIKDHLETIKTLAFYLSAVYAGFKSISILAAVLTALRPVAVLIGVIVTAMPSIIAAVQAFGAVVVAVGAAIGVALGPVTLIVLGIAAAIGVAYAAWRLFSNRGKAEAQAMNDSMAETQKMVDAYTANLEKQMSLRSQIYTVTLVEQTLSNKLAAAQNTGNAKLITQAKEALKVQSDKKQALIEQLKVEAESAGGLKNKLLQAETEGKINDLMVAQVKSTEEKGAAVTKAGILQQQAAEALSEALKNAGIDMAFFTSGVSQDFANAAEGIVLASSDIADKGLQAAAGIQAMSERLIKLSDQIKSPQELERFAVALKAVRDATQKGQDKGTLKPGEGLGEQTAASILAQAKINAVKAAREAKAGGAKALQESIAEANALQDAMTARVRALFDLVKLVGEQSLQTVERDYTRGLIATETYYRKRFDIAVANAGRELAVEDSVLHGLEIKRSQADTPAKLTEAQTAIDNQKAKIEQTRRQQAITLQGILNDKLLNEEQIKRDTNDINLKNRITEDPADLPAQLAQINAAYQEQIRTKHVLYGSEQQLALARERDFKRHQAGLDFQNTLLKRQVDLEQALVDQRTSKLNLAQKEGAITDTEFQNATNELIAQKQAIARTQREDVARQLAAEQQSLADKTGGTETNVQDLKLKLIALDTEIRNLTMQTKTYGESIRTNFTDALAQGIDAIISKGASLKDLFRSVGNSVRSQISQIISKDLAQKTTNFLVDITGGKGSSIFDKLGIGLGDKKPGDSASNPIYAAIVSGGTGLPGVDTPKIPGVGDGVTKAVKPVMDGITSTIKDAVSGFGTFISGMFSSIGTSLSGVLGSLGSSLSGLVSGVGTGLGDLFFSIFGLASGGPVKGSKTPSGRISRSLATLALGAPLAAFGWGGNVNGRGTGTSDSILSWLSNGEYVVRASAVKQWGTDFLDFVNHGLPGPITPTYAEGGAAGGSKFKGVIRDASSSTGGGTKIDKLVNNIDSRTDTGQVQQLVAIGVRQGIMAYDASLRAKGKIK